jgi:branched-chain amino acid transport system ATP-binding protein
VVRELYVALARLCQAGLTALVVEQDVATAQRVSSRLYCLQEGRVTLCGESRTLGRARISEAYFGV